MKRKTDVRDVVVMSTKIIVSKRRIIDQILFILMKHQFYLFSLLTILLISFFIYHTTAANLDLTNGRYVLFMDEGFLFDDVKSIFVAKSMRDFIRSISLGYPNYGRIFFNSTAFVSYLPYKFFGDIGLIVSNRMIQVFLLVLSYLILSMSVLKEAFSRIVFLVFCLFLPTTLYFATMPKPEPTQLFFFSLFILSYLKNNKSWPWIFLGFAFAAKCSFLFVVLYCFLSQYMRTSLTKKHITYFLVGFSLGEPLILRGKIIYYITSTFLATAHGSDSLDITFTSWVNFSSEYFFLNKLYFFYFIILATYLIVKSHPINFNFFNPENCEIQILPGFLKKMKGGSLDLLNIMKGWGKNKSNLFLIMGIINILAIMLSIKRLWPHYLHTGNVFMILGIISILEKNKVNNKLKIFSLLLISYISIENYLPRFISEAKTLSQRTYLPDFHQKLDQYNFIRRELKDISITRGKTLHVAYKPTLFLPENNDFYKIERFWGPFKDWDYEYDVYINRIESTQEPDSNKKDDGTKSYMEYKAARELQKQHLCSKKCIAKPCYSLYRQKYSIRIYIRDDQCKLT